MTTPPVPSPCVNVCEMHPGTGWCTGCLRTLGEIGAWSQLDDEQKRSVWTELGRRREQWRWMQQGQRLPGMGG